MMTRKERDEWAAALRSGRFLQGTGCLMFSDNGKDSYCCLGVKAQLDGSPIIPITLDDVMIGEFRSEAECRKMKNLGSVDLYYELRNLIGTDIINTLIEMNDSGMSFFAIADFLDTLEVTD